jgi:hypothetical protein
MRFLSISFHTATHKLFTADGKALFSIVFQCPKSFLPTREDTRNIRAFLHQIERDHCVGRIQNRFCFRE